MSVGTEARLRELGVFPGPLGNVEAEERGVRLERTYASSGSKEVQGSALGTPRATRYHPRETTELGRFGGSVGWSWDSLFLPGVWAEGIRAPGVEKSWTGKELVPGL